MAQIHVRNLDDWIVSSFRERAKRHGRSLEAEFKVLVAPGIFFGTDWDEHFRIGFGGARQELAEGLSRLGEGLRRFFRR